MGHPLAREQ